MIYASLLKGLKNTRIDAVMSLVLLLSALLIACNMEKVVEDETQTKTKKEANIYSGKTIIIDPGHGGIDPGKIGVNNILEKDVNLEISLKLEEKLKSEGFNVVMTRSSDQGLYSSEDSNKKRADMRNRCQIINDTYSKHEEALVVSIHQNSFTSESVSGAQVFYYAKSDKAKIMADVMQKKLNENINIAKHKQPKENTSYYMLLHTNCPAVIVECGFLSNWEEATNLSNATYQSRMAEIIYDGIIECEEEFSKQN